MEPFFLYIIKSSFCLVLLYIFFKALLSRETFFRFNRFVLLGGIIVSAILPLITLQISEETAIQAPIRQVESFFATDNRNINTESTLPKSTANDYDTNNYSEEEHNDSLTIPSEKTGFSLGLSRILFLIYILGFIVSLTGLLVSVLRMLQLIHQGKKINKDSYIIVLSDKKICPFSFDKYIVLSETDYKQNPTEIITHELVHARKKHSLDLIFMEFFILLHWFNPVIWLLKRELQDIHEYEADNGVITQGIDATQYQLLLVKKAVGARSYTIANSFNHSKIKNRITMMLKRKSTQWARFKLVLFVPVAAVVLQAFARPEMTGIEETLLSSEVTTISQEIQKWSKEYFDKEVDEYLKKPNAAGATRNWQGYQVDLGNKGDAFTEFTTPKDSAGSQKQMWIAMKDNAEFNEMVNNKLLAYGKKTAKKGELFPQILFLNIYPGTSEEHITNFLNSIGAINDQIQELRKSSSANEAIAPDLSPENAILVVINEKIKTFPRGRFGKMTAPVPPPLPKEDSNTKSTKN